MIHKSVGAVFLIAGTCVGAGMLALPVSTAVYSAIPATLLFFVYKANILKALTDPIEATTAPSQRR